jgi:hypothetical protein
VLAELIDASLRYVGKLSGLTMLCRITVGGPGFEALRRNEFTDKYAKLIFADPDLGQGGLLLPVLEIRYEELTDAQLGLGVGYLAGGVVPGGADVAVCALAGQRRAVLKHRDCPCLVVPGVSARCCETLASVRDIRLRSARASGHEKIRVCGQLAPGSRPSFLQSCGH